MSDSPEARFSFYLFFLGGRGGGVCGVLKIEKLVQ